MEIILTILLFIVVLSILVLIHELGHFVAARILGVHVEEFGLGFPPRLGGIRKGKTLYSLNLLPLGGFVRLKGEQGESAKDGDSFAAKKIWQKIIILAAGVFMNFFLTIVILTIGLTIGMPQIIDGARAEHIRDENIQVTYVAPKSPAETAGIKIGDVVVSINNQTFSAVPAIQTFIRERKDTSLVLGILRGSEHIQISITPVLLKEVQHPGIGVGLARIGIVSYPLWQAFFMAIPQTFYMTISILTALWHAISSFAFDGFVGPVGIASYTATVTKLGFAYLLNIMAQLSLSLAVLNFLPIPALDGGRVFFVVMEKLRGRGFRPELENLIHLIGFVVLISLLVLVTIKDIQRLFL